MAKLGRLAKNLAFRTGTEAFKKLVNLGFVVFVSIPAMIGGSPALTTGEIRSAQDGWRPQI